MKPFFKNSLILILLIMPFSSYAYLWPVFYAPDYDFLLSQHAIDTHHCPPGQGRVVTDTVVDIYPGLCGTYCPPSWYWIASSQGECHDLTADFTFQGYDIAHYRDEDGNTLYSIVKAEYGKKNANAPLFTLTFTSPKEYWYCIVDNAELHSLTCANDI